MFIPLICLALVIGAVQEASAQSYPSKPVRIIIGFPPGSITDTMVRPLAQKLAEGAGQQFLVDNRPGATGTIANEAVVKPSSCAHWTQTPARERISGMSLWTSFRETITPSGCAA